MASDEFPRGWTNSQASNSGTVTITIPAVAGIAHVLDSFLAKISVDSGASSNVFTVAASSSDGSISAVLGVLAVSVPAVGQVYTDEATNQGLGLVGGVGASLTVSFSGSQSGHITEILTIQGHDI